LVEEEVGFKAKISILQLKVVNNLYKCGRMSENESEKGTLDMAPAGKEEDEKGVAEGVEEGVEEADNIKGPLVFSCSKCRVIVGDSFSFLTSNEELNSITITSASNIQRSADVYTSKQGSDVGSTYFNFNCTECQAVLGKYYLTTSRDMDDMREKFSFDVNMISSYELGKSEHGKMPEHIAEEGEEEGGDGSVTSGKEDSFLKRKQMSSESEDLLTNTVQKLSEEVFKIQHVFLNLQDRMENMEGAMRARSTARASPSNSNMSVNPNSSPGSSLRPGHTLHYGSPRVGSQNKRRR